ncbi:MAG TPA: hypothetical protein VFE24_04255 [Pirellulales bacterium]|jgi:uncharacterized protein (DUF983 family)|nr:hypothetical protein [Pirellulales bacterium]
MPRDRQEIGPCPQCAEGKVICTFNRFVKDERIDSFEHRCSDCGFRETQAIRSAPDAVGSVACPFCGRQCG